MLYYKVLEFVDYIDMDNVDDLDFYENGNTVSNKLENISIDSIQPWVTKR